MLLRSFQFAALAANRAESVPWDAGVWWHWCPVREERMVDTYIHRRSQLIWGTEAEFQLYLEDVKLLNSDMLT